MNKTLIAIKDDLKRAMKNEVDLRKNGVTEGNIYDDTIAQKTVSRAIISMIPDLGKKPDETTDDDIIKLLKKYISQEKERAIYQYGYLKESDIEGKSPSDVKKLVSKTIQELGVALETTNNIMIALKYLPTQATEEDIIKWINENLDLTQFKNKMQAMGPIMKEFKGCDGNFVKSILLKL